MSTFKIMYDRIVSELRRSNLVNEAKAAINDAIQEAAEHRFYFNEMMGVSFPTVPGQQDYPSLGLVEIDAVWVQRGSFRDDLYVENNLDASAYATGNPLGGQLESISRAGNVLRLAPIPSTVQTVVLDGYGRLQPYPLVSDTDTNAWLVEGERYIRALAKMIILRDVIKDYGEARVLGAIAEDYKDQLTAATATRYATGKIRGTQW